MEGCHHLTSKKKSKTFPQFGNELVPPSKNISVTNLPIMYPLKQKDLCDYDPRFIISSGLIFDDIIMNIIRNKKSERHNNEENDSIFLQIFKTTLFVCKGVHFKKFYGKK